MEESKKTIDFPVFLASVAHDMKNSLGMLLNTVDDIFTNCTNKDCPSHTHLSQMHYEASRANHNLIQLLTLYKMDNDQFSINISLYSVLEFLEENLLQNQTLLDFKKIEVVTECPDDLTWFFDRDLMSGVINNALNNALRYARGKVKIKAAEINGYFVLSIEDNGEGYPEEMLGTDVQTSRGISFKTGSTGLGLYFASIVATVHNNKKGKNGFISISNGKEYGGGCFTISLP